MTWKRHHSADAACAFYTWKLDRPAAPALPNSFSWTWDHSTNWVLDDPGVQTYGCWNRELKALADPGNHGFTRRVCASNCDTVDDLQRFNFWQWLHQCGRHKNEMFL